MRNMWISFYCFCKEYAKKSRDCMGRWSIAWIFLMSLTVVGLLGGCGDKITTTFDGRQGGYLVALVNDSLALLTTVDRYDVCEETGGFVSSDECHLKFDNTGLHLVNYRKKQILWGDTAGYAVSIAEGFYRDSSVFIHFAEQYGFWKIGHKPELLGNIHWVSPCEGFGNAYVRPWINGNVLLKNAKGCSFAVLDTANDRVTEIKLDDDLAWIKKCDDVVYFNENVNCLFLDEHNAIKVVSNSVEEELRSLEKDSLYLADIYDGNLKWNHRFVQMYIGSKKNLLLEPFYFIESYLDSNIFSIKVDWEQKTFTDSMGTEVNYLASELLP